MSESDAPMATRERTYTIDDVWRMTCAAENEFNRYALIDGELTVSMSPGYMHARIASEIARLIGNFVVEKDLGDVTVESGHYSLHDRRTLLLPDVAFIRKARAPAPNLERFAPIMPDLAVEIVSPSQSMTEARRKAKVYLRHGTVMVWLVHPEEKKAEAWTIADDGGPQSETIEFDGGLSAGTLLPGFNLPLRELFQPKRK